MPTGTQRNFELDNEPTTPVTNLLEMMAFCSDIYWTCLMVVEVSGECRGYLSEFRESPWLITILSFEEQIFVRRLMQIH